MTRTYYPSRARLLGVQSHPEGAMLNDPTDEPVRPPDEPEPEVVLPSDVIPAEDALAITPPRNRRVASPPEVQRQKYLTNAIIAEIRKIDWNAPIISGPEGQEEAALTTKAQSIAARLVNIVLSGRDRDSIEAARLLFSYVDGLPVQQADFDTARLIAEIADARGLTEAEKARAIQETSRILTQYARTA